jgi:hypothetical protein
MSPEDLAPFGVSFANGLVLEGAATRSLTEMSAHIPGKVLEVHLRWNSTNAKMAGSEKLFIHVLDRNGQVPSQLDVPLLPPAVEAPVRTYGVPIADTLLPGAYRIRIGVYDPGQPGAPRLRTSDNSDGVQVGTLIVSE